MASTIYKLIEKKANPNLGTVPLPPLLLSLFCKNCDILKKIIEARADLNIRNLPDVSLSLLYSIL